MGKPKRTQIDCGTISPKMTGTVLALTSYLGWTSFSLTDENRTADSSSVSSTDGTIEHDW